VRLTVGPVVWAQLSARSSHGGRIRFPARSLRRGHQGVARPGRRFRLCAWEALPARPARRHGRRPARRSAPGTARWLALAWCVAGRLAAPSGFWLVATRSYAARPLYYEPDAVAQLLLEQCLQLGPPRQQLAVMEGVGVLEH